MSVTYKSIVIAGAGLFKDTTKNKKLAELYQRLWISYGYFSDLTFKPGRLLYFDLNSKKSCWVDTDYYSKELHILVADIFEFCEAIANPQKLYTYEEINLPSNCTIRMEKNGNVSVITNNDGRFYKTEISSENFEKIIQTRSWLLNN